MMHCGVPTAHFTQLNREGETELSISRRSRKSLIWAMAVTQAHQRLASVILQVVRPMALSWKFDQGIV